MATIEAIAQGAYGSALSETPVSSEYLGKVKGGANVPTQPQIDVW